MDAPIEHQLSLLAPPSLAITRYASGVASPAIFAGYRKAGAPMCLAVHDAPAPAVQRMAQFVAEGGRALIDSGAFERRERPETINWPRVFDRYALIARHQAAGHVEFVLPDVVGDQQATLALTSRCRAHIQALRADGCRWLQPVQRGAMAPEAFWDRCVETLGFMPHGIAIPSAKAAFPMAAISALAAHRAIPPRVHFLGISRRSKALNERALRIIEQIPNAQITADAVEHRAHAGKGRRYTTMRALALETLCDAEMESAYDETEDGSFDERIAAELAAQYGLDPEQMDDEQREDLLCSLEAGFAQWRLAREHTFKPKLGPTATTAAIEQFARESFSTNRAAGSEKPEPDNLDGLGVIITEAALTEVSAEMAF